MLEDAVDGIRRYVAAPDEAVLAIALWAVHAHTYDCFEVSPRLMLTSPEKRCGKTTALTVLSRLVPKPLPAANTTASAVFRSVEKYKPTLLIDEADTFLREKQELGGILNSGHYRPMAYTQRTVGDDHNIKLFSTWAPVAVAVIGRLTSTLEDRSVVIPMRRRAAGEEVAKFRIDRCEDLDDLCRQIARWAQDNAEELAATDPDVPDELHDRAADNWRPLLAIADHIGGNWPELARSAAIALSVVTPDEDTVRTMLLADIRDLFESEGEDKISTKRVCSALAEEESRPWPEFRNSKPITAPQVAKLLKAFGIRPKQVWTNNRNQQGYARKDFQDAFKRYLPPGSPYQDPRTLDPADSNGSGANANPRRNKTLGPKNGRKPADSKGSRVLGSRDRQARRKRKFQYRHRTAEVIEARANQTGE